VASRRTSSMRRSSSPAPRVGLWGTRRLAGAVGGTGTALRTPRPRGSGRGSSESVRHSGRRGSIRTVSRRGATGGTRDGADRSISSSTRGRVERRGKEDRRGHGGLEPTDDLLSAPARPVAASSQLMRRSGRGRSGCGVGRGPRARCLGDPAGPETSGTETISNLIVVRASRDGEMNHSVPSGACIARATRRGAPQTLSCLAPNPRWSHRPLFSPLFSLQWS